MRQSSSRVRWTLQPDIQYVFNSGASFRRRAPNITMISKNALVIGVRTKIDF
jgi:hypothetical protein